MAIKKTQGALYMKHRNQGKSQSESAARAGMSERTGQRLELRNGQKERKKRCSTRVDPLKQIWEQELIPMLRQQPGLQPITLFEHLQDSHPGEYNHVLRTLQRRIKQWRDLNCPTQEVMFRQEQRPGKQALVDFTVFKGITILIAGAALAFRLFHLKSRNHVLWAWSSSIGYA